MDIFIYKLYLVITTTTTLLYDYAFCARQSKVRVNIVLILCVSRWDTADSIYDTAWSEINESQIIAACGDGSVKMYDIGTDQFPVQSWQEHNREVYAVSWNLVSKDTFASSSWDGTIKVVSHIFPLHSHGRSS